MVEAIDLAGLRELLERIERGEVKVIARDTVEPSPLCHELINANPYAFLDDAPLEERRTRAVSLRRGLGGAAAELAEVTGGLDAAAITAAEEEVALVVRDADELHDALQALWLIPWARGLELAPGAARWMDELVACGRATVVTWRRGDTEHRAWACTERLGAIRALLPGAVTGEDGPALADLALPAWVAT